MQHTREVEKRESHKFCSGAVIRRSIVEEGVCELALEASVGFWQTRRVWRGHSR